MQNSNKNNRGQVLVLVAISLVVILGFAALAIDLGYFYHTKNQLQGAADAAALAGAAALPDETDARTAAVSYAFKNIASGSAVQVSSDGSNTLTPSNDITVGHWNGGYTAGGTPINAVQVRARKTDKDTTGFPRLFGKIFDTTKQNINTEAIAARPARASEYLSFCKDICSGPLPRELQTGPTVTMNGFAWTTLNESVSSANNLKVLLCDVSPFVDNCGKQVWSTMGVDNSVLRVLESLMYNPNYERITKDPPTGSISGWTIMAPYIDPCPPGAQPDPQTVIGYAYVHITAICSPGGGGGSVTSVGGPSCTTAYSAPAAACSGHSSLVIVIDSVQCYPCGDPNTPPGYKAVLVK